MKIFKQIILPYLIPFVIGLMLFLWVLLSRNITEQKSKQDIFRILSDACFIPGCIVGGVGLLVFLSNEGAFDIISYGLILFFGKFKKNINERKYQTYYDYKVAKHQNKKNCGQILIVGIFYIACAVLFLILFYN